MKGIVTKKSHDNNITQTWYVKYYTVDNTEDGFGVPGECEIEVYPKCIKEGKLISSIQEGDEIEFSTVIHSYLGPRMYAHIYEKEDTTSNITKEIESWEELVFDFIDDSEKEGKPFMMPVELEEWLEKNYPNGVKIKK